MQIESVGKLLLLFVIKLLIDSTSLYICVHAEIRLIRSWRMACSACAPGTTHTHSLTHPPPPLLVIRVKGIYLVIAVVVIVALRRGERPRPHRTAALPASSKCPGCSSRTPHIAVVIIVVIASLPRRPGMQLEVIYAISVLEGSATITRNEIFSFRFFCAIYLIFSG